MTGAWGDDMVDMDRPKQEIIEPSTALVVAENKNNALTFVKNGLDPILDKIKESARTRAAALDISTQKGRAAIVSLSVEVRDEKTALEKIRVNLVAEKKRALTLVDEEAGRAWDELEKLQKEIRQPVTDWENKDRERIAAHESAIQTVHDLAIISVAEEPENITSRITQIENDFSAREWEEFKVRGDAGVVKSLEFLVTARSRRTQEISDAAELAIFRAEEERKTKIFHDLYDDAEKEDIAFNATKAAENKAADEARITAEEAAATQQKIIDDAAAAKIASDKALQDAEDKRLADLKDAKERSDKAIADALKKQKDDAAAAQKVIDDAEAEKVATDKKRAGNVAHQGKINREALAAIIKMASIGDFTIPEASAKAIIIAIIEGKIPHVTIKY